MCLSATDSFKIKTVFNEDIYIFKLRYPWGNLKWNQSFSKNYLKWIEQVKNRDCKFEPDSIWMSDQDLARFFYKAIICEVPYRNESL